MSPTLPQTLKRFSPTLLVVLVISYFIYHVISGNTGLITVMRLDKQHEISQHELDILTERRKTLEHKVTHFYDNNMDRDLLDERARRTLGYVGKNETVYFLND